MYKTYLYRKRFQANREFMLNLCLNSNKELVQNASTKQLNCVILYLRLLLLGELPLSSTRFRKIRKSKLFSYLESEFESNQLKNKSEHRALIIKILPILKHLLDSLI